MNVGARRRRAEVGARVRLHVTLYELEDAVWAYAVSDMRHRVLVRAAEQGRGAHLGRAFAVMRDDLAKLLDVQLERTRHGRIVRTDERWDVAVHVVGERDEIPYRAS